MPQDEIKTAVTFANQERKNNPRLFETGTEIAFYLGNLDFWKAGTEKGISFTVDPDLARELATLRKDTLVKLKVDLEHVHKIDCVGMPRDGVFINLDDSIVRHQIRVVEYNLQSLIAQATPNFPGAGPVFPDETGTTTPYERFD